MLCAAARVALASSLLIGAGLGLAAPASAADDCSADTATTCTVRVDGLARGNIEISGDRDWFRVRLDAGKTYRIDLTGWASGQGTLWSPLLLGVHDAHDASGDLIRGTTHLGHLGSRRFFKPLAAGEYYIAAGAHWFDQGTYHVHVTKVDDDDHPADTGTTGSVAVGGSVTGSIEEPGDRDWFSVTLEANKEYRIDLKGLALFDPYLHGVHKSDGKWIYGTWDDNSGPNYDSRVYFEPDAAGVYYVAAGSRRYSYDTGRYRLFVTEVIDDHPADNSTTGIVAVGGSVTGSIEEPGDRDWFGVNLDAGKTYRIDLKGRHVNDGTLWDPYLRGVHDSDGNLISGTTDDNGGVGDNSRLTFEPPATGTYYVAAGANDSQLGTYRVSVTEAAADDYPADTSTTGAVSVGGSTTGSIEIPNDRDWFKVTLEAEKIYRIDLRAPRTGTDGLYETKLWGVYDAAGDPANTVEGVRHNSNAKLYFRPGSAGSYYIAAGSDWAATGTYTLSVTELVDDYPASTSTTGTVTLGGSATGTIENPSDLDWFGVMLEARKMYRIDLERASTEGSLSLFGPRIRGVHDASGRRISGTVDKSFGTRGYSWLVFEADTAGKYYIAAGTNFSETGTYRLSVADDDHATGTGTMGTVTVGSTATGVIENPGDRDWFKVVLEAGKTYRIDLEGSNSGAGTLNDPYLRGIHGTNGNLIGGTDDDDNGGGNNSLVVFKPTGAGNYYIAAGSDGNGVGSYRVSVREVVDHSADTGTTGRVAVGGSATGFIQEPSDRDWFKVALEADKTYRIDLEGWPTRVGTLEDPYLRGVHDASGDLISGTTNDDVASWRNRNSRVDFMPDTGGTYYISAGANRKRLGTYTLSVADVTPTSPATAAPGAPTGLAAEAGDGQVTLGWEAPTDAEGITGWRVRHGEVNVHGGSEPPVAWVDWADIEGATAQTTSHVVTDLSNGTLYAFQVRAMAGEVEGDAAEQVSATPETPSTPLAPRMEGSVPPPEGGKGPSRTRSPGSGSSAQCRVDVAVEFLDGEREAVAVESLTAAAFTVENGRLRTPVQDDDGLGWSVQGQASRGLDGLMRVRLSETERWSAEEQVFRAAPGVCAPAARNELTSLSLGGLALAPVFAAGTTSYTANAPAQTGGVTVTAAAVYGAAEVAVAPADADTGSDGHQVALAQGEDTTITVTVTPSDGSAAREYTVTVNRAAPPALTASFHDAPTSHDGEASFMFELRFSENVPGLSYRTLQDFGVAFRVTNGRVTRAVRLQKEGEDRNRRWKIAVKPRASEEVSIALAATEDCEAAGAICTADGGRLEGASLTVPFEAVEPAEPEAALSASFVGLPEEHDGSSAFTFELRLSENVRELSYRTVRDSAFTVTDGRVTHARRMVKHGENRNRRWEVTVAPEGYDDVTVALPATTDCAATGAICGVDGEKLSGGVSGTVQGPPALAVADARAEEGTDATLDFEVTLGRAPTGRVTVEYATADGTAVAGEDYTATSGTLTFEPGETEKTVSVAVLDDAVDEGREAMTLRLSNASGAWIEDGEAEGTITNSDPVPQAWLARFGRTVTGQVLDAVAARLGAPRTAGVQASLAGQALPSLAGGDAAANDNAASATRAAPGSEAGAGSEDRAALAAMTSWLSQTGADGRGTTGFGASPGAGFGGLDGRARELESWALSGRDFVLGTSFALTGGSAEGGGFASVWGHGAMTRFDGREGALTVDGEVTSGFLGADWASERWTAGLALGHSRGAGDYRKGGACDAGCGGAIEATLTGLYPYAGVDLTERLSVWAAAGHGAGEVRVAPDGRSALTADLTMSMGAAGVRSEVLRPEGGAGLALAVKADTRFTRTSSDAVRSDNGNLEAADADVWLVRFGVEGSRRFALGAKEDGASMTPSFELGVRRDGGDAETGLGADLGAGLVFADPAHGLTFESRARGLIAHEADGFREWGANVAFGFDPSPETDRGLALTLTQSWGASSSGGMDALLGRETLAGLAAEDGAGGFRASRRLEGELGYGLPAFGGGFTGTPNVGFGLSEGSRDWRVGWRLTAARRDALDFELSLDATRREPANNDAAPEHGVTLRAGLRW